MTTTAIVRGFIGRTILYGKPNNNYVVIVIIIIVTMLILGAQYIVPLYSVAADPGTGAGERQVPLCRSLSLRSCNKNRWSINGCTLNIW